MRLKWVRGSDGALGSDELVLESFELVPLPSPSPPEEPQPDAELSIAAAALLANICSSTCAEHPRSPTNLVVTTTVPLVEHTPQVELTPCEREVLAPVQQERLP